MCKPRQEKRLEKGISVSLNKLNDFFGFLEVDIECPNNKSCASF